MTAHRTPSLAGEYIVFALDGEPCAMSIRRVREVLGYQPLTAVPNAPRTIRGVMDLRGKVVPIVDLAAKFGFASTPPSKWTCLIVVEASLDGEPTLLAVVADTVDDVVELGAGDFSPPPSFGTRVRLDYLLALGRVGQRFVLVLDVDRLLTPDEIFSLERAAAEERAP